MIISRIDLYELYFETNADLEESICSVRASEILTENECLALIEMHGRRNRGGGAGGAIAPPPQYFANPKNLRV